MCSHWTEAKLFKFLRLYKHHECLWNPYSPEYGNGDKKAQSLSEILSEMNIFGLTINECLKQMKYVRQTYKDEQRRLERLASLGGRTFSKLLWYPLMSSMLSKVIRDEDKLNQATGTLDLVVASNQLPNNSWDERSHCRALRGTEYRRRSLSWTRSETTSIFSYPPNLGYGDYVDRCPDRMVANNNSAENEHLGSCPTCGHSSGSFCDCFSINDYPYNSEIIEQSYNGNSRSQIDYRPRTSYNYRNGILEINSAVRIPVSQPASNYGYSQLMESITQEQPEFSYDELESSHRSDFRNIEEAEDQSTECCANSFNNNLENDKLNDGCKSTAEPMDVNSYPSNLPINKNGVRVKCRLKKSNRAKQINVDKILCAQNLLGSMSAGLNSTCDRLSCADRGSDDTPLIVAEKNLHLHLECPKLNVIIEEESKVDVNTTCCGINLEVARTLRTEENISSKICQGKLKGDEDSVSTEEPGKSYNSEGNVESLRSGKTEALEKSDEQFLQDMINECNRKKSDSKRSEDVVQKSKDVVKRNLTKIVIACISKILNKPVERRKIDAGERMILKKVVEDLKLSLRDGSNCVCNKKSISKDHQRAEKNTDSKSCNKNICWREPIEESLNTVSCRSTKSPAVNRVGLPRMVGGADFESRTNKQSSMSDDTIYKNLEFSSFANDCEFFASNDELRKTDESTPSYLQDVEICGQSTKAQCNLNGKNCENHKEFSDSISSSGEITEVENGVTVKVSIETSGSTEDEILDKVVNKITDILRQTLDENGYSIEKKQFFSKKNLIANDEGEMSRELISNEAVWRSELANIIGHLMKHKEADDPITFRVKTMILPVKNQSNISTPEASNVNVAPKTREKNVMKEAEDRKNCYKYSPMKSSSAAQCGIDGNPDEFFGNSQSKVSDGIRGGYKMIIERSESVLKTIRSLSVWKLLDRFDRKPSDEEFKGLDCTVSLCESNRESQRRKKLLTHQTRKSIKRSRDILSGRLLRNLTYLDKISIKDENQIVLLYNNDRHKLWKLLKCLIKFRNKSPSMLREFENLSHNLQTEKDGENNHSNAAGYRNKLLSSNPVRDISKDFNVYLYTQVSKENEPTIVNKTGCNGFRSIGSNTNDTQLRDSLDCFERGTVNGSGQDPSRWELVRYLETEGEILNRQSEKKSGRLNQNNKNPEYKSRERSCPKVNAITETTSNKFWCSDEADGVEILNSISRFTIKERPKTTLSNGLKLTPSMESNCHILNVFSSHNQNMSRRVLLKFEDGNEASLCCPDFEDTREDKKHGASDRSESDEDEPRIAAENQTKSCCAGDSTNSICTPICDVTSRLRLCAIVKPPNKTRGANRHVESDNVCCCDKMIKPRNVDHESSRKNVSIGDASVRSISTSSQTESIKEESQSRIARDRDCSCNLVSQFRSACDRRGTRISVDIDTGSVFNVEEKLSDGIGRSRPAMNDATVQSSIEDPSSVSLEVPNSLDGESLVLEVKMLNPLFSIELKKRHKYRRKVESAEEQHSCELLEREEHEVEKVCDKKRLSCGSQTSHFDEMQSDSKHKIEVCIGNSTSSNPVAVSLPEDNEPGEKLSSLDRVRCQSISLDASQSLENFQNETDIQELEPVTRSKESEPKPGEDSAVETEALAIGALISTVERSLQLVTDPVISQKLEDIIEYIRHLDQDQGYASKQVCTENSEALQKNTIEMRHKCEDETVEESVLLVTEGIKRCQRLCKSLPILTGINRSTNDQEVQVNDVEFSRDKTGSEYSGVDRNAQMETESPSTMKEIELVSADERQELGEIFDHSTSTIKYLYGDYGVEGVESNSSCDQSIEERLNVAPSRLENFESFEDDRRPGESNGVDINVFTSTVASQLRELSTEAALRSQRRIQTLISNSRLESEKNKKYR